MRKNVLGAVIIVISLTASVLCILLMSICTSPANASTRESKPQIVQVQRVDAQTFVLGDEVLRTKGVCYGSGGARIDTVAGTRFLVFFQRKTRRVMGLQVGSRWVASGVACEVSDPE